MYVRILMTFTANVAALIFPLYNHWRMIEIVLNNDDYERGQRRERHINKNEVIVFNMLLEVIAL